MPGRYIAVGLYSVVAVKRVALYTIIIAISLIERNVKNC